MNADRLDAVLAQARRDRTRLDGGAFGTTGLTAFGIAAVVGAGIFVSTGIAASHDSGPAVVISFLLAAIVAAATALCYAELSAMIPVSGSTYSYAYVAFGLFPAWFIGWDLLLDTCWRRRPRRSAGAATPTACSPRSGCTWAAGR